MATKTGSHDGDDNLSNSEPFKAGFPLGYDFAGECEDMDEYDPTIVEYFNQMREANPGYTGREGQEFAYGYDAGYEKALTEQIENPKKK
jgi:hypothetical protein